MTDGIGAIATRWRRRKAWLDEAIRTGRVVDETEQALREGLGAFLITGVPRQADRKRVRRAGRRGRARTSGRPEEIDRRNPDGQ